jgi:hypothetical protein
MWATITQYILVNVLLFSSWYIYLFTKRGSISFVDRLIGSCVLGLAQIIATELVLGLIFRMLYAGPLFWLNVFMSSTLLAFTLWSNNRSTSTMGNVVSELNEKVCGFYRTMRSDTLLVVLFILLAIKTCWIVFIGYLFPSYTWDSLYYHLPIVGNIIQSGAILENPDNFQIDTFINIFPKNMELFFLWNVIFLKSSSITDLSQLLFIIIGILTTYSIAMKLHIGAKSAIFSSFLIFFTPVVILQINTNYIDIAVSVLLLTAVNFLLYESLSFDNSSLPVEGHNRKYPLFLAGVASGILLGSKGSGPLFTIIIVSALIVQEIIKHRKQIYPGDPGEKGKFMRSSMIPYTLYFFLPLIVLGSYWYIKNWVLYGNPVYPMEISVLNITIFKGLYKKMLDPLPSLIENSSYFIRLFHVWTEKTEFYLYDSRLSGLGPLWFILLLPSLVFALLRSIRNKEYNWLFVSILLIVTFAVHPRNWTTRYTIFMVALGAISYGSVMDFFGKKGRITTIIALLLAAYTFLTVNSLCVMPSKIREFMDLPAKERNIARHKPFNIDIHARQEYGYWMWISNYIQEGETLAYTFDQLFLAPLWNDGFSSKTVYAGAFNYHDWLRKLKDRNVTYVLLRTHSEEDIWIEKKSRALTGIVEESGRQQVEFQMVFSDDNYKIVKLVKAEKS